MFQTVFLTTIGAIVGTAGSIVLATFVKNLPTEIQLAAAAFLGAICSSVFVCREKSIQKKLGEDVGDRKKGALSKLKVVLFWLILVGGLVAVGIAGLKVYGRL